MFFHRARGVFGSFLGFFGFFLDRIQLRFELVLDACGYDVGGGLRSSHARPSAYCRTQEDDRQPLHGFVPL